MTYEHIFGTVFVLICLYQFAKWVEATYYPNETQRETTRNKKQPRDRQGRFQTWGYSYKQDWPDFVVGPDRA